ncbi:methyl-accepting chemotaxis protein, partial [uncultured Methanofollis sp.]|uniref:methyl-accepting chemotaxis protein n=1 Tax=uncultured Methanofollis sp. TaxID=262500 RepID=UPI0026055BC7
MKETSTTPRDRRSFLHYVVLFVFLVISVTIGFLSTISYLDTRGEIVEAYEEVMDHTDEMIREAVALVNREEASRGQDYSTEIVAALDTYVREYTPPPDNVSLPDIRPLEEHLQRLFGKNTVTSVHITRTPEVADVVRYSRLQPTREVRTGPNGSVITRVYDLTPDGAYLLEAAVVIPEGSVIPAIYQHDIVQKAREVNPFIESVRVYNTAGKSVIDLTNPMNTTASTLRPDILEQIIMMRADVAVVDDQTHRTTRYLFVDPDGGTDENTRIVEVTYNLKERVDHIKTVGLINIITGMLGILFGTLVTLASSWYIARPVDAIVEDVGIIAHGNLDHRIRATKGLEFARLEDSINIMVRRLKETITKLRESEEQVREY